MNSAPHDDDDSVAAGFARRDSEIAGFPVGPTPAANALDPDYELAVEALTPLLDCESESFIGGLAAGFLIEQVQVACATARAQGRAEARGAATAPSGTPPPPDRNRVAEAL